MQIFKKNQFHFPYTLAVSRLQSMVMVAVITIIVLLAALALNRQVNTQQYQLVMHMAQQQKLADTQRMASDLLAQGSIKNIAFYRLLHAYHYEQSHIRSYPAVELEPEQEAIEPAF